MSHHLHLLLVCCGEQAAELGSSHLCVSLRDGGTRFCAFFVSRPALPSLPSLVPWTGHPVVVLRHGLAVGKRENSCSSGWLHTAQTQAGNGTLGAGYRVPVMWFSLLPFFHLAAGRTCHLLQMLESLGNWTLNLVPVGLTMGHPFRISI